MSLPAQISLHWVAEAGGKMQRWRIYTRRGGALRKVYGDGSNWKLHKSYDQECDAKQAFNLLNDRHTDSDGFKYQQIKLVGPNDPTPKTK